MHQSQIHTHLFPCRSGYTRGQGWSALSKAWLGYKIANNPKKGESFQNRLGYAVTIQNIQTDMGLPRTSFPTLGLLGDCVWTYNLDKELELQDQHEELKEYKKKKRAHIQEIVDSSMLTDEEIEMMREYGPVLLKDPEGRYVERVVMV